MRRRITEAFIILLALSLIAAGAFSLLLVRHAVSLSAQRTVLKDAQSIQEALTDPSINQLIYTPAGFALLKSLTGVSSAQPIDVGTNGQLSPRPVAGSIESFVDGKKLLAHKASSGVHNHIAFAAVPLFSTPTVTAGILFTAKENFTSDSLWYFLLASGIALLAATAIASVISKRIAARVSVVADASDRIAFGDLTTRVPVLDEVYPELARLEVAVNTMADALESAREAEKSFLLSISHDLRTPLTSIRGYAEAIADGAVPDLPAAAQIVISEARRLDRLIGDLLDLSRLRAHQFSFNAMDFDLVALVAASVAAFQLQFESLDLALRFETEVDDVPFYGDPDRIAQILANLIENAMKFATRDVVVRLSTTPTQTVIGVSDDGQGIDPEDLPHVFERLYSSARSTARAAGTGLGLAIVTELCEAMHATVQVTSPVAGGHGTLFWIDLPAEELHGVATDPG
jgi:two-component system sensor histidine kinase BaeS